MNHIDRYTQTATSSTLTADAIAAYPNPELAARHSTFTWTSGGIVKGTDRWSAYVDYRWECECGTRLYGTTTQDMHHAHIVELSSMELATEPEPEETPEPEEMTRFILTDGRKYTFSVGLATALNHLATAAGWDTVPRAIGAGEGLGGVLRFPGTSALVGHYTTTNATPKPVPSTWDAMTPAAVEAIADERAVARDGIDRYTVREAQGFVGLDIPTVIIEWNTKVRHVQVTSISAGGTSVLTEDGPEGQTYASFPYAAPREAVSAYLRAL